MNLYLSVILCNMFDRRITVITSLPMHMLDCSNTCFTGVRFSDRCLARILTVTNSQSTEEKEK